MLNKREKKTYGAYIDYFLEDCEVVSKPFDITHMHVTETFMGIPEGIYGYEPKTGILALDDEHFGVMNLHSAVTGAKTGKVVFLKHKQTWSDMKEGGLIKEAEDRDVANTAQKMMQSMGMTKNSKGMVHATTSVTSTPQHPRIAPPPPPAPKTGGLLIKKLFNKKN